MQCMKVKRGKRREKREKERKQQKEKGKSAYLARKAAEKVKLERKSTLGHTKLLWYSALQL